MGRLSVVGTPIGNLSDISPRGIETLERVDFIAAEALPLRNTPAGTRLSRTCDLPKRTS